MEYFLKNDMNKKIKKNFITLTNLIWAFPISIIIYIVLNRFFIIRIGSIPIRYFGHLVGDLELYLSEKQAGHHIPNKKYIDIWSVDIYENNKSFILEKWKNKIIVIPPIIGIPLKKCFDKILFSRENSIKSYFYDRDIMGVLKETNPQLQLTEIEIQKCIKKLKDYGIDKNKKIVTISIRDDLYHKDREFTNYRNGNINNLIETIKYLLDQDYIVIRMGSTKDDSNIEFILNNKNYINYSRSNIRSEAMEVYLGYKCDFVITSGTGWDSIPTRVYRKPAIYIDYVQISNIPSWSKDSIYIFKKIKLINKNRFLNLQEIFYLIEHNFDSSNPIFYQLENKIELINNSSHEILNAVKDYLYKKQITELQNRYRSLFIDNINKYNLEKYHHYDIKSNSILINIADSFINNNSYLLDDVINEDIKILKNF